MLQVTTLWLAFKVGNLIKSFPGLADLRNRVKDERIEDLLLLCLVSPPD